MKATFDYKTYVIAIWFEFLPFIAQLTIVGWKTITCYLLLFVRNRRKNNKHFIYIHTKQYHNMCLYAICFPTSSISHKKTKFMWLDSTAIIISKRLFCYFYFFEWFWSRIHVCPVCHGLQNSFMGEDIWKKGKKKRLFFANVSQRQTTSLAPLHLLIIHFATKVSVWWKRYISENIFQQAVRPLCSIKG